MQISNRRPQGMALAEHSTPIGRVVLAATDEALLYCGFAETAALRDRLVAVVGERLSAEPTEGQKRILDQAAGELDGYLAGERRSFTVPLDLRLATPFSREVNLALAEHVPYGSTATYGALAAVLNRPRAARAVGAALGANPLCVVLPCHRIVGASGRLTGYAGGVAAKRYLLDVESGAVQRGARDHAAAQHGAGIAAPLPASGR